MGALDDVQLHCVTDLESAFTFKRWLGERRPVLGVDTETSGLEWWSGRLRLVQYGDANTGWVLPAGDWLGLVKEVQREYDGPMTLHNASFDAHWLRKAGAPLKPELVDDTLVMAHLLDPPSPHGLKPMATALIDDRADIGAAALHEGMKRQGWTWDTVPADFEPYWLYSALDGVLAARLHEHLKPRTIASYGELYELEMALSWVLVDAEARGLHVDETYARSQYDALGERSEEIYAEIEQRWGVRAGSNDSIIPVLLAEGVPLTKLTESGKFSLDKEVLAGIADKHPLAGMISDYRRACKFRKAYYGAVLDRLDGARVHPSINQLGARTGRMSVSNPALQQIPSGDVETRRMFTYPEGHVGVSVDYSNIEVRVLAHFSQEPALLEAFRAGKDPHLHAAAIMYGEARAKAMRKPVKSGVFAKLYGAGPSKVAVQQGITPEAAARFLREYDEAFPGVAGFVEDVQALGESRYRSGRLAYVDTPAGRRLPLSAFEARDGQHYKLTNYLCQGTAADVVKLAIVELDRAGLAEHFVLPVHDETLSIVPREDAADYARQTQAIFEGIGERMGFTVPLSTDAEIYTESWGQCIEGKLSPDEFDALVEGESA